MKAIILAAGRGSRMASLTQDKPKCLIKLGGKTLLDWQLEALRIPAISQIGIVCGYLADKISVPGLYKFTNPRWLKTNMVMSLACACDWLREDRTIVSYSDIIYPAATIDSLSKSKGDIVISYYTQWSQLWRRRFKRPLEDLETFCIDDKGRLLKIGNKPKTLDEIEGQYMGLMKFSSYGWSIIENYLSGLSQDECDRLDITSLLQRLIQNKVEINTVAVDHFWYEIDNENDLKLCRAILKQSKSIF